MNIPSEFKPPLLSGEGNSSLAECNFGCLVTFVDIPQHILNSQSPHNFEKKLLLSSRAIKWKWSLAITNWSSTVKARVRWNSNLSMHSNYYSSTVHTYICRLEQQNSNIPIKLKLEFMLSSIRHKYVPMLEYLSKHGIPWDMTQECVNFR